MSVYRYPPRPPQGSPGNYGRRRTRQGVMQSQRAYQMRHLDLLAYAYRHHPEAPGSIGQLSRDQLLSWLEKQ